MALLSFPWLSWALLGFLRREMQEHSAATGCRQIHFIREFLKHFHLVDTPHCGSRCLWCAFTPSACHPWCHMFERALFVLVLSSSSLSLAPLPFLFHCPPVLCPAHQLQKVRFGEEMKSEKMEANEKTFVKKKEESNEHESENWANKANNVFEMGLFVLLWRFEFLEPTSRQGPTHKKKKE